MLLEAFILIFWQVFNVETRETLLVVISKFMIKA